MIIDAKGMNIRVSPRVTLMSPGRRPNHASSHGAKRRTSPITTNATPMPIKSFPSIVGAFDQ